MSASQEQGASWRERYPYWLILVGGLMAALLLLVLVPSSAWANPRLGVSAQTIPPPTEPPTVPPTEPPTVPPTKAPFPEPSPEPSPEPTKRPTDKPCSRGEISGRVIDDCNGQPVAGIQVQINGAVVTTDSTGHFSLSGLSDGRYTLQLLVPNAPPPVTVDLLCDQVIVLDPTYNSCPPEATPAAPEFLPVTGGAAEPPIGFAIGWVVVGASALALGLPIVIVIWHKTRS